MNKITFPLKLRMKSDAVADLQDALQVFLDQAILLAQPVGWVDVRKPNINQK
jgi:hypothetical protein